MNKFLSIVIAVLLNVAVSAFRILKSRAAEEEDSITMDGIFSKVIGWVLILGFGTVAFALGANGYGTMFSIGMFGIFCIPALFIEKHVFHAEPNRDDWFKHGFVAALSIFCLIMGG